jgi:hypothetical protein
LGWSVVIDSTWFCCTKATSGSAANCLACRSLIDAAKPVSAAVYRCVTFDPSAAAVDFAASLALSLYTTM